WNVMGSLGADGADEARAHGDARLAAAIAIAARETLLPHIAGQHERLQGTARAASAHEKDGARHWDEAAKPLVIEFARNARLHGADRRTSALQALSAAAHLKGKAMASDAPTDAFMLGAAASSLLRGGVPATSEDAPILESLVRRVASLNDVRETIWDGADAESMRLMGAAAAFAAFGKGRLSKPYVRPARKPGILAHLPSELGRLAHLTAAEAATALEDAAADPRLGPDRRRRLETIAEALRLHPSAHAVSCAEALEMDEPDVRTSGFEPGMNVYRAVPDGRRRMRVCEGKNGRPVRCRTVASADGAIVGSLAYDALSREFGGRPLYAAYALDGNRYGYAWADERPVIRRGEPEQGFRTAPERIPV
ncbi:MAG TPA: hypothetical protein VL283_01240, partial [Candidatus Baltobacteraceae bacterium]|nr:hypothetical protein [Candidatus Baltobacteraceae bacterium]